MPSMFRSPRAVSAAVMAAGMTAGMVLGTIVMPMARGDDGGGDEITFLEHLARLGYTGHYRDGRPVDQGRTILFGVMACNNLRNGMSVEEQLPKFYVMPEFPTIAEAAQHELCPDTLG